MDKFNSTNVAQIQSLVRDALKAIGYLLVLIGAVPKDVWDTLSGNISNAVAPIMIAAGSIISIGSILWSFFSHKTTKKIDEVSKLPSTAVVTNSEVANSPKFADNPNVIPINKVTVRQ